MQEVVLYAYDKNNVRRRVFADEAGNLFAQMVDANGDALELTKGLATADESLSVVLATDQTPLPYQESQAAVAEDNANGVIAVVEKGLATNTYAPSVHVTQGTATKASAKGAAGNVRSIHVSNKNATGAWFALMNKSSAPAASEALTIPFWVPGADRIDITFPGTGLYLSSGIGWIVTSTQGTATDNLTASDWTVVIVYA